MPRVFVEGAVYYITNRSIQGHNIFQAKGDYEMYLELLEKYKKQYGFKLFAFVLMPAHIHLLLETKEETSISDVMHNITSSYTKYYNGKYNRKGHLFRGRFKATLVEKGPFLLKLTRYIHENPQRSGLAADAEAYLNSSYLFYARKSSELSMRIDLREEVREVLSSLEGRSYEEYMQEETDQERSRLHKGLHRKLYLGSEQFGRLVKEAIEVASAKEEEQTRSSRLKRLFPVGLSLLLVGSFGFYLAQKRSPVPVGSEGAASGKGGVPVEGTTQMEPVAFELVGLDGTIWQIKFVAGTPFQALDLLHFEKGRMVSENLKSNGYPASNYSLTREEGRVIWETLQTSPEGTASWRGEVEGQQVRGILSLRQNEKKPQDFSFISIQYRRIES